MNPISWSIDEQTIVRTLTLDDAEVIFRAIDANRDRLRPYMPGSGRPARRTTCARSSSDRSRRPTDEDANGIWVAEEFAGIVGLRSIRRTNTGEIGYWNVRSFEGRGLITRACRRFFDYGFRERMLHRIEIRAAADNLRSRAVAERLGFTLEGTMRDGHRMPDDTYVDQVVYGLLEAEWRADVTGSRPSSSTCSARWCRSSPRPTSSRACATMARVLGADPDRFEDGVDGRRAEARQTGVFATVEDNVRHICAALGVDPSDDAVATALDLRLAAVPDVVPSRGAARSRR